MSAFPADSSSRPGALPLTPGPLVGRAAALGALGALLRDPGIRLVTLTGAPGVGKTRLGLAAAATIGREFADGVVFVDLTAVRDADLVPVEIVGALRQETGAGASRRVPRTLVDREALLVLDNFEHVLPAARSVGDILTTCPGVTALVTSRERLRLRVEREVPVPALAVPGPAEAADPARLAATPAVALLVQQVRGFDPSFTVTAANRNDLAEICVRLDGLPLALELAAARLRMFTPAELLAVLRHRLGSLAADAVDVPDRHRTLTSALAWSHDLLDPGERAAFRQLAVFVGGWTLQAATRVCALPDPVATTSLVDKNLVRRVGGAADVVRFGMLESLREFAGELLERSGEGEATRERHAAYFADLALGIERRVGTADERSAIEEVGLDVGNLRAALAHYLSRERPAPALPLAAAIGWYSYTRGDLGQGQADLETVIAAADGDPDASAEALAGALQMVGAIALARGDVDGAEERLRRSLAVNRQVGSLRLRALSTAFLGHVARTRERPAEAVALHEEAGRLFEQLGNVAGIAWSRYDLGLLAHRWREPERAAELLQESLVAFRDLDYTWAIGCAAWALSTVELSRGRLRDAAALLSEALDQFEASEDSRGLAQSIETAAGLGCAGSAPADAARLLGAAAALRARLSAPLPVEEQAPRDAVAQRVRDRLGRQPADAAEAEGRAMPIAAALVLARDVLTRDVPAPDVPTVPAPGVLIPEARPGDAVPRTGLLTPREHQVAALVREGRTNRQIGRRLGISEKTAEVHVHNIIRKLGASSRAEIAAWVAAGPDPTSP